jgi:hypothetical protein
VRGVAKDAQPRRKKSKIRTLIKWFRRISLVAAIVGAVRKYQTEQNESRRPPTV